MIGLSLLFLGECCANAHNTGPGVEGKTSKIPSDCGGKLG